MSNPTMLPQPRVAGSTNGHSASAGSVSVVLPTYNGSAFIGEALASICAQTLRPREVIVVDDASPDDTAAVVESLARDAPVPIRLIRLAKNSGSPAHPLNVGIGAAAGDLVAVLDQDDLFTPHKLQEQAAILAADETVALAFGCCARTDAPDRALQPADLVQELRGGGEGRGGWFRLSAETLLRLLVVRGNFIVGYPGFMFRRKDWRELGGLDESYRIASDYDLLCRLCARGPGGFVPGIHYLRREHGGNMTLRRMTAHVETARVRIGCVRREGRLLRDGELVRWLRGELVGLGYWMREAGHYREAARCYLWAGRVGGWKGEVLTHLAKLLPHWLFARLSRRPPRWSDWTVDGSSPELRSGMSPTLKA